MSGRLARSWTLLVLLIAVLVAVSLGSPQRSESAASVRIVAAGDFSSSSSAAAVLLKMKQAAPTAALALGDLSYSTAAETTWCNFAKGIVGTSFPLELVAGNHESNGQHGSIGDFAACLPNRIDSMSGSYGRQYYFDLPSRAAPLVRVIMISANQVFPDGTWGYSAGSSRYNWLASSIDSARSAGAKYIVVGTHFPCMSVTSSSSTNCPMGADVVNLLLSKRVDLVLTGHEHSYQRTYQLALRSGCSRLNVSVTDSDCIVDSDRDFSAGAGTVFATVGTGGRYLDPIGTGSPRFGYFAATSGSNKNATFGALQLDLTDGSLQAQFLRAAGGSFTDSFRIGRGTQATPTPTATSTAPPTGGTTLVGEKGQWRWLYPASAPPSGWTSVGFNDSGWATGTAPIGFGASGIATNILTAPNLPDPRPRSFQMRRNFTVADPAAYSSLTLTTRADDGVVVYLNGTEVARGNMPTGSVNVSSYPRTAPGTPIKVEVAVPLSALRSGQNTIAAFTNLNYRSSPNASFEAKLTGVRR